LKDLNYLGKYFINTFSIAILGLACATPTEANLATLPPETFAPCPQDPDTTKLLLPIKPDEAFASDNQPQSPLYLMPPSNVRVEVVYDPITRQYTLYEKVGKYNIRTPRVMSAEEYRNYMVENSMRQYWQQRRTGETQGRGTGILPRLQVGGETFDRVFGSNTIEIIPQGNAQLTFGIKSTRTDNTTISEDQRKNTTFDFKSQIQMNVAGKIGEKLRMEVNYNTEATFDFENNVKVEYNGFEDEIIQKIEAGNVALPLPGTLITGSQSLFGFKTQLKFGKLNVTSVFSKQNGQTQVVEVKGGAQVRDFQVSADEYDANKHFFLSHYFRENYNRALQNLPVINSGVTITKIEVWVTNKRSDYENARGIVAFMDLAERGSNISCPDLVKDATPGYPQNESNNLYGLMTNEYKGIRNISEISAVLDPLKSYNFFSGIDFEKVENARRLSTNDYTLNPKLGYISLNSALNADEVLAVAYEYTVGGQTFKVGELSSDGVSAPDALIVKLLKGTNLTPSFKTWKLMMKNIYSINAYQVSKEEFQLDVLYQDPQTGTPVNYISEGPAANKPLIKLLNLDNVNSQNDAFPDGVFDFIEGVTINPTSGKIIFPVLEPFGSDLAARLGPVADDYVFQELYDMTLTKAKQVAYKNKFLLSGTYKSSSGAEIQLNATNIPKGSVVVTAGGMKLREDDQYIVDYNIGTVKIIDQGLLESGTPIKVSVESNALFSLQTKTMVGSHFDYQVSDKFNIGATIINLTERPLTQKVSFGNEAISNTIWGFNTAFQTESKLLTKMVDFLPFIQTKEKSNITFDAEFAHLIPGSSKAIGRDGTVYLDDFEGTNSSIDMKSWYEWRLASTPQNQRDIFPEAELINDRRYGYNRAHLAWYTIDPLYLRNTSLTPANIKGDKNTQSSHWVREIFEKEIFPNRNTPQGQPTNISVLNLAFYPNERGPYNYNLNDLTPDGKLVHPENRWGGITRSIGTTDFETSNIEYIEFWLMDPFVYKPNSQGGDLYFNLGNVSEDILRDGKKAFETGLPTSPEMKNVETTNWGRVSTKQYIKVGFEDDQAKRDYQDVGLDGLSDKDLDGDGTSDEANFFGDYVTQAVSRVTDPAIQDQILNDPSNDNFIYHRSSYYDSKRAGILERYKRHNMVDGNTPVAAGSYSEQNYPDPDVEDLGTDLTMNETEAYWQYQVSLRPQDMEVGRNYITNKVTKEVKFANGQSSTINWYQFKIPIYENAQAVGPIEDFKSIRFMRMFLRGFTDTTILRFATLELVRGEWRKYSNSLIAGQEGMPSTDLPTGSFVISSVNIEENNDRTPVNYILPPGVSRVIDPSQPQLTLLNEQAMEYKIVDLGDGDARAAYKNLNIDIRHYRKLKMHVHAEMIEGYPLNDNEVTAFIRLGSDYTNNYYEYEIPLKLTPHRSTYNDNREADRIAVWPLENEMVIDLEELPDLKIARNDAMKKPGSLVTTSTVYTVRKGNANMRVTGNPNLGNVKVIMIGVRNPSKSGNAADNGTPKSVVVWLNELRLTNFDDQGGWAANARLSAKLADLGVVTVAGSTTKPGFGSIESKVNDRNQNDIYQYDLSSTLELGRFFPAKSGIRIPMFVGYSESISNPKYNPVDPDIALKKALDAAGTRQVRDSIKNISQDYTRRKSINFTNVKIDKKEGKPHFYDISNFSVSYSYSEQFARNITTDHKIQRNIRGALTYNYNSKAKNIVPFKNVKFLNSKYLRLVKDFNFSLFPSQFSFRTDLNRSYFEQQKRNLSNTNQVFRPTYSKDFLWNRTFSLNWDLTQALKFDFTASNVARIDEPEGMVDKRRDRTAYEHWRDSVWANIKNLGRNTQYNHQLNLTYSLPLSKIPFLDWTSASARYSGNYRWEAGAILADTSQFDPGNTIQNSNAIQLNGQLNLTALFNKVPYLKGINQRFDQRSRGGRAAQPKMVTVKYEEEKVNLRPNVARSINHQLKTDKVTVKVYNEQGKEIKVAMDVKTDKRITIKSEQEAKNCRVVVEGKVPEKENPLKFITEGTLRMLMGVKSVSLSYSQTNGTLLPGYKPGTKYLGLSDVNGVLAPGYEFVAGWQDPDIVSIAIQNGWLTKDTLFSSPVVFNFNENINFRSTVEPVPGFRIEISANRTYTRNRSAIYQADEFGQFNAYSQMTNGNFGISILSLGTAFERHRDDNLSKAFEAMKAARLDIAERLRGRRVPNAQHGYDPSVNDPETGYPVGYGPLSQEVLIPSFLAAYSHASPSSVFLGDFPLIPMPNWQVTYDGLSKLKPFKNFLRTFTLTHGYRSLYSIGAFTTNSNYSPEADGFSYAMNQAGNFIPQRDITNVSIVEQFSPLIGVDMNWINSLTTRFEVKSSRSLALSLSNNQLTEITGWDYIVGAGYRFENLLLVFQVDKEKSEKKTLKSDLRLRLDFAFKTNRTTLRKLVEDTNQPTAGQLSVVVSPSADYRINEQVTIKLYYNYDIKKPYVTTTYGIRNIDFGFSVRFEMAQ
jgi:cell surface protein SprA